MINVIDSLAARSAACHSASALQQTAATGIQTHTRADSAEGHDGGGERWAALVGADGALAARGLQVDLHVAPHGGLHVQCTVLVYLRDFMVGAQSIFNK